jgi:integrase
MSALNTGVRRKHIPQNPAEHVELPSGRRPKSVVWTDERVEHWRRTGERPAVAVWTPQQTGTFLDAAMADRLYPLYHLIAYRGLRRGEAIGIQVPDVDLDAGYLRAAERPRSPPCLEPFGHDAGQACPQLAYLLGLGSLAASF